MSADHGYAEPIVTNLLTQVTEIGILEDDLVSDNQRVQIVGALSGG